MFTVATDPKFTIPVTVCVPQDGGHKEETCKVTFRVIDIDLIGDALTLEGQKHVLRKVVVNIHELVDDDKQPITYSDEIRDKLIGWAFFRGALLQHYVRHVSKTRLGNSVPLPGIGQAAEKAPEPVAAT